MKEKNNNKTGVVKTTPDNKRKKIIVISLSSVIVILMLFIVISKTNLRRIFSNLTVSSLYKSSEVEYDNSDGNIESKDMQGAIDELYTKCLKLKEQCPDGYECIEKKKIDLKKELKESLQSLEEKTNVLNESYEEEKKDALNVINEVKNQIYNDNYDKFEELKELVKNKINSLDIILKQ